MNNQYPNEFYEQLSKTIVQNPGIRLRKGETCFYQGPASTLTYTKTVKEKPKKKTTPILTPWFFAVKRKTWTEMTETVHENRCGGHLYITNMRWVLDCRKDGFELPVMSISGISYNSEGLIVSCKGKKHNIVTGDVDIILSLVTLMNNAFNGGQSGNSTPNTQTVYQTASSRPTTASRNDAYAIAAFIHYCERGKPVGKKDSYPRYFEYDFHVNDPVKYHKKVIEGGYLEAAPASLALNHLKKDDLQAILTAHNLPSKGKKEDLVKSIIESMDLSQLKLDTLYIPTEKGAEYLKQYEYLFEVKTYGITFAEFEAYKAKQSSQTTHDIIWRILSDKFNQHNTSGEYPEARNEQYNQALFLGNENRRSDALLHYVLVLYYDLSGCGYRGQIVPKHDLTLAPAVLKEIFNLRDAYMPEIIDRCFDRYSLPHHYFNKRSFAMLLDDVFADETIDISNYN